MQVSRPANKNPASREAPRMAAHTKENQYGQTSLISGLSACWIRAAKPARFLIIKNAKTYYSFLVMKSTLKIRGL